MKNFFKVLLPILVVLLGFMGMQVLIASKPELKPQIPEKVLPRVRVLEAQATSYKLSITAQGTVEPRTESTLFPEVAGRIISVSPSLEDGAFFEADEVLLEIDPVDYELAVVQARSAIAQAELNLENQKAAADLSIKEWKRLGKGEPTALVRYEPQIKAAEASLEAAKASLRQAQRNLSRTRVRAPYTGRVRMKHVDVGQSVAPAAALVTIYAVDYAEIRLPVPHQDLAYINVPMDYRDAESDTKGPGVTLSSRFAGKQYSWQGHIIRTDGEIDPMTRMVTLIARVTDPYGRGDDPDRPPLAVGMYVDAEIAGRQVDGVFIVPRAAMRGNNKILVVDGENRIHFRDVEIYRAERDRVILSSGVSNGDRICISPLDMVVEGMEVNVTSETAAELS